MALIKGYNLCNSCSGCVQTEGCAPSCQETKGVEVMNLIAAIDDFIYLDSVNYLKRYNWGYSCEITIAPILNKLINLKDSLLTFLDELRYESAKRCDKFFRLMIRQVNELIGSKAYPVEYLLEYDGSNKDTWTLANPTCVAYESWEKSLYNKLLPDFSVRLSKSEPIVCFAYDLIISKKKERYLPVFKATAGIIDACEYGLKADIEKVLKDCSIDYKVEIKEDNCVVVTFDKDIELNSCELGFDVISKEEFCQIIFEATGEEI